MKNEVRVANVLFDDRLGGPQKRVIKVGRCLKQQGVHTLLILPSGEGDAEQAALDQSVEVRRVKFGRIPRPRDIARLLIWFLRMPIDVLRLRNLFISSNVDIVHVNGAFFVAPSIAAKTCGLPLVWHLNDTIVPKRLARILGFVVRVMADRCVVAANAVATHYGLKTGSYTVIYAPVDIEETDPIKGSHIGNDRVPRIGLIANWNPVKGLDYFVGGVGEAVKRSGRRLDLVFAGGKLQAHKEYADMIESMVDSLGLRDNYHYLGFVDDVPALMRSLDILVLSSTSEACPMVVLEAMSVGLPVVAANVGGVEEILKEDGRRAGGVIVKPGDSHAIGEGILELLNADDMREEMGQTGYARARAVFSTNSCVSRHLDVYRSLCYRTHSVNGAASSHGGKE